MYAVTERPAARARRDNRSTSRAMPSAFVAGSCRQNSTSPAMTPSQQPLDLLKFTPNELISQTPHGVSIGHRKLPPVEGAESSSALIRFSRYYPACSGGLPVHQCPLHGRFSNRPSGSSAFRPSTTPVSMSLAGSRFSSDSAPRPLYGAFFVKEFARAAHLFPSSVS